MHNSGTHDRKKKFMHMRKYKETKAYGKLGNSAFSTIEDTLFASSSATMSAKWYSKASLSVARWETRSVISNVKEVKPSLSR